MGHVFACLSSCPESFLLILDARLSPSLPMLMDFLSIDFSFPPLPLELESIFESSAPTGEGVPRPATASAAAGVAPPAMVDRVLMETFRKLAFLFPSEICAPAGSSGCSGGDGGGESGGSPAPPGFPVRWA